jgi:hypothetical protein
MSSDSPSVGTAVSRSTLTIIVPGIVALAPWFLLAVQQYSFSFGLDEYPTVAHAFLFAAVAIAGSLCNGLGTIIESKFFDQWHKARFPVEQDWFDYLAFNGKEPVAFRYLGRLAITLSFELSMVIAAPIFAVSGALWLYLKTDIGGQSAILAGVGAAIVAAGIFFREAKRTHLALCETRFEVLRRLRAQPAAGGFSGAHP